MSAISQQDAIMQGVASYLKWKKEFLSSWEEALMKGQLKQAFAMMPPQMKEWLKQNDPKGYAQAMSALEGGPDG